MKKNYLIISLLLMFVLCGCASKEDKEIAAKVSGEIQNCFDQGGNISTVIDEYNDLTDEQKALVKNTEKLENIKNANEVILLVDRSRMPSQSEFDNVLNHYNNLSSEEKRIAGVDDYVEKYRDIDLNTLISLQDKINKLPAEADFDEAKILYDEYEQLSDKEKNAIQNIAKVKDAMALSEWEKAGVGAVNFIKSCLRDPSSFELRDLRVKKQGALYFVVVNYYAKNGLGAKNHDAMCVDINSDFSAGMITLSLLSGKLDESSNLNFQYFLKEESSAIDLDPEKIMANLDTPLND